MLVGAAASGGLSNTCVMRTQVVCAAMRGVGGWDSVAALSTRHARCCAQYLTPTASPCASLWHPAALRQTARRCVALQSPCLRPVPWLRRRLLIIRWKTFCSTAWKAVGVGCGLWVACALLPYLARTPCRRQRGDAVQAAFCLLKGGLGELERRSDCLLLALLVGCFGLGFLCGTAGEAALPGRRTGSRARSSV